MTNDERLARLEERVNNLCDDLKELKDGQNRILSMLQNGYFEQKVKNVIKQQIGGWILGIFLSGSFVASLIMYLLRKALG